MLRRSSIVLSLCLCLCLCGCLDPDAPGNLVPPTVDEDPTLPRIEVAGTVLHSESFGDPADPMVLVLHGGPGADYRSLLSLRDLADDGNYVVFWDQRGAGLSRRHPASSYTLDGYLEDLRLVLEHVSTDPDQPVVFIGHSWGAMYAAWFIDTYGDYGGRIRGAILSEPGAFTNAQLNDYFDRLFGSLRYAGEDVNDAAWVGQVITARGHERADYLSGLQFRSAPAEHGDPNDPFPEWRAGAVVQEKLLSIVDSQGFDWTTNLRDFAHPVLFLRGELNTAMPLEHQQELASYFADAEVVTIPDVGHEMIYERPDEYLEHARAYLADIGFGSDR